MIVINSLFEGCTAAAEKSNGDIENVNGVMAKTQRLTIAEKDEHYYNDWIGDGLQELAQRILGIRRWIRFRSAITVLSRFGYFAVTTLSNIPTPGEEFCEALPSNSDFMRHLLMVALNNELQLPSEIPKSYSNLVKNVHLITFFLFGDFYELAKRASNFFYTTTDTTSYQSKRMNVLYRIIGCVSLVQLIVNISKQSQNTQEPKVLEVDDRIKNISHASVVDPALICHLCSERKTEPTSTLCGHIFCWKCIHQWLKERSECPICRTPTEPSRLIHLINFR